MTRPENKRGTQISNMNFPCINSRIFGFFLLLVFPWFFSFLIEARAEIPAKQGGFWYGGEPFMADSVLVEAFFDPVCPDSRDSWPPLKKALQHYGSAVALVVYTFPLPYHDNAFVSSRALHTVDKLNSSATYILLEAIFKHQKHFYGVATFNESRSTVVEKMVKFVTKALGTSYRPSIEYGFTDSKTDHATRISFKYGCLRGVYGTPFFFVNGFPLPDAGSALDFEGWRRIIDPLVIEHGINREKYVQFL